MLLEVKNLEAEKQKWTSWIFFSVGHKVEPEATMPVTSA